MMGGRLCRPRSMPGRPSSKVGELFGMRSPLIWFVIVAFVGAAVAGCGGTGSLGPGNNANSGGGGSTNQSGTASIRVLMASPDYNSNPGVNNNGCCIDVYIDNVRVWQNMSYATFNGKAGGSATPPYYVTSVQGAPLSPSAHSVTVYAAGAAPGNASQLASTTTAPGATRTTVVVADKVFGAIPLVLQAIPYTEPVLEAPFNVAANVVMHHASPSGAPGLLAYGKLAVNGSSILPSCLGTMTFSNPPGPLSEKLIPLVKSGGKPIGFYVAGSGISTCLMPTAEFFPATQGTPSPPPSLGGFPNSGIVYPTPIPNPPGVASPPPLDCDSTLPPTCNGVPPNPQQTPLNPLVTLPNLSLYAIDAPPSPPATTVGIAIVGIFDSNNP